MYGRFASQVTHKNADLQHKVARPATFGSKTCCVMILDLKHFEARLAVVDFTTIKRLYTIIFALKTRIFALCE